MTEIKGHIFMLILSSLSKDLDVWRGQERERVVNIVILEVSLIQQEQHSGIDYTSLQMPGSNQMHQGSQWKFVIVFIVVNVKEVIKQSSVKKMCWKI